MGFRCAECGRTLDRRELRVPVLTMRRGLKRYCPDCAPRYRRLSERSAVVVATVLGATSFGLLFVFSGEAGREFLLSMLLLPAMLLATIAVHEIAHLSVAQ